MDENNSNDELNNELEGQNIEERNEIKDNIQKVEINNTKEVTKIKKETEKVKYVDKKEDKDKERRGRDREIVVQYRKPSLVSSILLILIGIMIATIVLLLLYIFKGQKEVVVYEEQEKVIEDLEKEEEKNKPEVKELDLSLNGEFVQNLYNKVPVQYWAQEIYSYTKTTEANLTGLQKMLFILNNMKINNNYETRNAVGIIDRLEKVWGMDAQSLELQVFSVPKVEEYFKSVFGSNQNIIKEDIETNLGYIFEYDKQDNCFYGHSYSGGGGFGFYYQNMIDSVEKNEDGTEIYIYDYYIKCTRNYAKNVSEIYTYSTSSNLIGEETNEEDVINYDQSTRKVSFNKDIINKYKNNGLVKFKHTFKLDDNGDYYWYSCEPTEIN